MSAALPPEVRTLLTVLLARHDQGGRGLTINEMVEACHFIYPTVAEAMAWLERRAVVKVPIKRGTRRGERHDWKLWSKLTLDAPTARALLGGAT
jgi:hypothetical protein